MGIIAAVIAGVSALWWMPFYPVWAFVYIVITALVVYALAVYGGDREQVSCSPAHVCRSGCSNFCDYLHLDRRLGSADR